MHELTKRLRELTVDLEPNSSAGVDEIEHEIERIEDALKEMAYELVRKAWCDD